MNKNTIEEKEIQEKKFRSLQKLVVMLTSYLKLFCVKSRQIKLYAYLSKQNGATESFVETRCNQVLEIISSKLKIHPPVFTIAKPKDINCIDASINRVLKYDETEWLCLSQYHEADLELDLEKIVLEHSSMRWNQVDLITQGAVLFTAYFKGNPMNDAILFVQPCGMPAEAFFDLLETFQEQYFVMTWENPFLFHSIIPRREWCVTDDIQCIKEMIHYFKCSSVHLIGTCGGVPIAILAAAELKEQIVSLSSCHGDIYLGLDSPMTNYKKQFLELTKSSLENDINAIEIYETLLEPTLILGISDSLAPYIIYQYLSFDLYMKYAYINTTLMTFDLSVYLDKLNCNLLIISSEDDRIAHPGLSKLLSEKVKNAVLWMRPHAEHHDVITGDAEVYSKIMSSIENFETFAQNQL